MNWDGGWVYVGDTTDCCDLSGSSPMNLCNKLLNHDDVDDADLCLFVMKEKKKMKNKIKIYKYLLLVARTQNYYHMSL